VFQSAAVHGGNGQPFRVFQRVHQLQVGIGRGVFAPRKRCVLGLDRAIRIQVAKQFEDAIVIFHECAAILNPISLFECPFL